MIWVCLPVIITVLKASVIIFANEDNVFETDIGDKIQFDSNSNNLPLLIFQQAFCGLFLKQNSNKNFCYENDFFHCHFMQPLWYPIFIFTKVFVVCGIYGIYRRVLGGCWWGKYSLCGKCGRISAGANTRVCVKYILRENKYKFQVKGCHKLLKEIGLCEECGWVALSVQEPSPLKYCQLLHWSCYTSWYFCRLCQC